MTPRVAFTTLLLLHVHVVCDIKTKAKNKASGNIFFTLFRAAIRLRANMGIVKDRHAYIIDGWLNFCNLSLTHFS